MMCGCSVTAGRVQEAWPQGMVLLELRGASASMRSLVAVEAPGPVPKETAWASLGWAKEPCIQQILLRIQQGNLSSPPMSPACQHPQEANLAFLPRCLLLSPQEHLEHLFLGSMFSCSFPKLPASSPRGTLVPVNSGTVSNANSSESGIGIWDGPCLLQIPPQWATGTLWGPKALLSSGACDLLPFSDGSSAFLAVGAKVRCPQRGQVLNSGPSQEGSHYGDPRGLSLELERVCDWELDP